MQQCGDVAALGLIENQAVILNQLQASLFGHYDDLPVFDKKLQKRSEIVVKKWHD